MSTDNAEPRISAWKLWRRNGLIWATLLLLLLLSLVLADVPMGLLTPTAGIVIAFAKALSCFLWNWPHRRHSSASLLWPASCF